MFFFTTPVDTITHQAVDMEEVHPAVPIPEDAKFPLRIVYVDIFLKLWKQKGCEDSDEIKEHYRLFVDYSMHNCKELLDHVYLIDSFKRSDYVLFAMGKPVHIIDGEGRWFGVEKKEVLLGFATMHRVRFDDFLYAHPVVNHDLDEHKWVGSIPRDLDRVLVLETIGSRYNMGRMLMNTIERDACQVTGCQMVSLRAIPARLPYFIKRGYVRSNDWKSIYPLHEVKACDGKWYLWSDSVEKEVSHATIFKGDGPDNGYLATKYVGKYKDSIRDDIRSHQGEGRCLCWKFLGI